MRREEGPDYIGDEVLVDLTSACRVESTCKRRGAVRGCFCHCAAVKNHAPCRAGVHTACSSSRASDRVTLLKCMLASLALYTSTSIMVHHESTHLHAHRPNRDKTLVIDVRGKVFISDIDDVAHHRWHGISVAAHHGVGSLHGHSLMQRQHGNQESVSTCRTSWAATSTVL